MSGEQGGLSAARGGSPAFRDGRAGCVEWRGGGDTMSLCPGLGLAPGTCNYCINAASIFCCCCCWSCCCCICCNIRSRSTGWLGPVTSPPVCAALSVLWQAAGRLAAAAPGCSAWLSLDGAATGTRFESPFGSASVGGCIPVFTWQGGLVSRRGHFVGENFFVHLHNHSFWVAGC